MKQTSLFSFISRNGTNPPQREGEGTKKVAEPPQPSFTKTHFYLHWLDKKPKAHAHFREDLPKLCNFKKTFQWKSTNPHCRIDQTITLCGYFEHMRNVDPNDKNTFSHLYKLDREKKYRNVGYLKSLLQKAIRRKDVHIAVKCAFHYMTLDIEDFLRRLPIIMIEDTAIHDVFPTLIWLMIASTMKEFKFEKRIYEYLMGTVYVIAGIPIYRPLPQTPLPPPHIEWNKSDITCAIALRIAYGGMACDVCMMEHCIDGIVANNITSIHIPEVRPILLESISHLQLSEWILEAIDFHCAPQIIEYMKDEYPQYSEEYIKGLIWHYSSKINMRTKHSVEAKYKLDDWNKIKAYLRRVQYYLLEENY